MMRVTRILPLDKKRSQIWLDEEFAFVLYKGELRRFNIEEGGELKESDYIEITGVILPKRAKLRAMNLLMKRSYSEFQLRQKLAEGMYPEEMMDLAIDYVKGFGYLDDLRLSEEFIRIHIDNKSRQRIVQDLSAKGIKKDVITLAFENCKEEGFESDEVSQAKDLLEKRGFFDAMQDVETLSYDERQKYVAKQYAFLSRKGFRNDVIRKAMRCDFDFVQLDII